MTHKNFLVPLAAMLLCIAGCSNRNSSDQQDRSAQETVAEQGSDKPATVNSAREEAFFVALGTEPFWGLYISDRSISLFSLEDTVHTPYAEPSRAMDDNIKRYRIGTEAVEMNIVIRQDTCANAMSGKVSPYTADIDYRYTADTGSRELKGCGSYITDQRLHDIWALESLRGKEIEASDFDRERPYLEIHANENSFMGFAGCNTMNGSIFYEPGLLRFINIATTRKMCPPGNIEMDFLSALQGATSYQLGNNRLTLLQSDSEVMVFRKVD